jgi:hypothetical protein
MSDVAQEMLAVDLAGAPTAELTPAAVAEHAAPAQDAMLHEEPGTAPAQDEHADDARITLDNCVAILDNLGAATLFCLAYDAWKSSRPGGDYIDVTLVGKTICRVVTKPYLLNDGTITESVIIPDGKYETSNGLFIAVQRNANYSMILWCKWAGFEIDCVVVNDFKVRVNCELMVFLFDYIDNGVQWPSMIDPLVKYLMALSSYSYDALLCLTSQTVGISTKELYPNAFKNVFARSISHKPLLCQAFYMLCLNILAEILAYKDAVWPKYESLMKLEVWMETVWPRLDETRQATIWRGHNVIEMGVHEMYRQLNDPIFKFKFTYDTVCHSAKFAQEIMTYGGAPIEKKLDTVLDNYIKWWSGTPSNEFTPIEGWLPAPYLPSDDDAALTVSESSSGKSSPIESSRRCLLEQFVDDMSASTKRKFDELLQAIEADENDN